MSQHEINDLSPRTKALVARKAELPQSLFEVQNCLSDKKLDIKDVASLRKDLRNLLCSAPILEQKALQRYLLCYRPELAYQGIDNVFLSLFGNPLTENSVK